MLYTERGKLNCIVLQNKYIKSKNFLERVALLRNWSVVEEDVKEKKSEKVRGEFFYGYYYA